MNNVFIDTETTGLDPRLDKLRIVTINGIAYDIWDTCDNHSAHEMLSTYNKYTFVAHNAQFDLDFLAEHMDYIHAGPVFDTMVAWQILNAGRRIKVKATPYVKAKTGQEYVQETIPANLDYVCQQILNKKLDKSFQKADWSNPYLDEQMLEYAEKDTEVLVPLVRELTAGLNNAGLMDIFKMEMKLLPVLLAAKRKGVYIDREAAEALVAQCEAGADAKQQELPLVEIQEKDEIEPGTTLFSLATVEKKRVQLNARSPQQVTHVFGIPDAEEDTLRRYIKETDDERAKTIMEIKKLRKRASWVQKQMVDRISPDGRVHPSLAQAFTETGRLSGREPNFQQVEQGDAVRSLITPEEANKLVVADYSGLELRIVALLSGDKNMQRAFKEGRDLHSETCSRIFGKETKRRRTLSKNINFLFSFGGGHARLIEYAAKQDIEVDEATAKEYHKAFHAAYPTLSKWQKAIGGSNEQYVYSILGRRRYITPGEGYSTRINMPVQSTAADGMKLAMVYLYWYDNIRLILSVHDETLSECHEDEAEYVLERVESRMIEAMYKATRQNPNNPIVPILVDGGVGNSWAEAK